MEDLKGVILAGGLGTRLRPMTNVINKHLICVYDQPMIYYPLMTLKNSGIKDIMVITGEEHAGMFVELLKDGREYGVNITYGFQHGAGGIAEALKITRKWLGRCKVAVILGDNYFEEKINLKSITKPTIFTSIVSDANRFGVYFKEYNKIIEKPKNLIEGPAVTGLYVYHTDDLGHLDSLKPSDRKELEITDFNNILLEKRKLDVVTLGGFWSDMGTPNSLLRTANHIANK